MKQIKKQIEARKKNPTMVTPEVKKQKAKDLKEMKLADVPGLQQVVKGKKLHQIITKEDAWQTKGRTVRTIIKHDGVKKIADFAKVSKDVEYKILTQPDAMNNYQTTMSAKVCIQGKPTECATELGESNRSNLSGRGKNNPANMAEKRAYDRAVFRLLGITGILSEEELSDEEETEENMDTLSHDERKQMAPVLNKLLLAKNHKDLIVFNRDMKAGGTKGYNDKQLGYLRSLYQKRHGELTSTAF